MKDIAIIGVSSRFPEAKDLETFRQNLIEGKDSVREPDANRLANTSCDLSKRYKPLGFLDDIDQFDHKFFNISKSEAIHMDPHQRLMLQVAYEALENSGYPLAHFDGSDTAVFIGDTEQEYYKLATVFDPTLVTGNSSSTTAGRIARHFNLRGLATMLDTACSSSLLAIHMGCNEINNQDAEMSLACGVRFIIQPEEQAENVELGIMSADGKTRSFSEDANGTGAGEAVGAVLLKSLDKALQDGDYIHAVIKGTAANQDAQLSGSLTAPSSQAQAEVIQKAWKRAGIDPLTIDYIETHGSGTKLGDPIEVGGIDQAYAGLNRAKNSLKISSVKSNIAHTGGAAGISGVIKAILAIQNGEHYPSLHYNKPNPFIDFDSSVTQVQTTYEPWSTVGHPRRCGVSSFGLSGTNVHIVLEEAPKQIEKKSGISMMAFSAKNRKSILALDEALRNELHNKTINEKRAAAASATLSRTSFSEKAFFIVQENGALSSTQFSEEDQVHAERILFLFSPDSSCSEEQLDHLSLQSSSVKEIALQAKDVLGELNENSRRFVMQLGLYNELLSKKVFSENVLGLGTGDAVVAVILEELSFEEALREAHKTEIWQEQNLRKKLKGLIQRESEEGKTLFIEPGFAGSLSQQLEDLPFPDKEELAEVICLEPKETSVDLIGKVYLSGISIHIPALIEAPFNKYPLPRSIFNPVRCWLKPISEKVEGQVTHEKVSNEPQELKLSVDEDPVNEELHRELIPTKWTATEQKVAAIWIEVLHLDSISLTDDFFALGGHSLMATRVIARIENTYGIHLVFKDIFTFATVKTLAAGIDELLASGATSSNNHPMKVGPVLERYPLSQAQKRMWLIHERSQGENLAYNLPAALHLKGAFDVQKAETILTDLVIRHDSLRTVFGEDKGTPFQEVRDRVEFKMEKSEGKIEDLEKIKANFLRPFKLDEAPLWRVRCVELAPAEHILFFDMHHIVSDGVSLGMITQEFLAAYQGENLTPLEYQYKDYALWQAEAFENGYMKQQGDYWATVFENAPTALNLPYDHKLKATDAPIGKTHSFSLNATTVDQIKNASSALGGTPFMYLLSCYHILLSQYSGQKDFVIGTPIAGRSQQAMEQIIGMFVNTLPMRNQFEESDSFSDFFKTVIQRSLQAFENQDYPFEQIVDELELSNAQLFNTMFVLQNLGKSKIELEGLEIEPINFSNRTAQFDLTMEVNEVGQEYLVNLHYNAELFDEPTLYLIAERFQKLLSLVLENKHIAIRDTNVIEETASGQDVPDIELNF